MQFWALSLFLLLISVSYGNIVFYNDTEVIGDSVSYYLPSGKTNISNLSHHISSHTSLIHAAKTASSENNSVEERIYDLSKCGGAGCPYSASWLIHINLFKKTKIFLDSTKMEAASFLIFDKAHFKFQVVDEEAYFVHHMSMYEHLLHKKYGFETSKNKTLIMSQSAFHGECSNLTVNMNREFLAIIPFYGGLPPNVTSDLSVKSIGQGNSLVDAGTKALQCMATLCSCLKYYGHVAIGVVRNEDKQLILSLLDAMPVSVQERVHLIQFQMGKPANLPFHLMAWAQSYVHWYNCQGSSYFPHPRDPIYYQQHRRLSKFKHHGSKGPRLSTLGYSDSTYATADIFHNESDAFRVCSVHFDKHHVGGPVNIIYHRRSPIHRFQNDTRVKPGSNSIETNLDEVDEVYANNSALNITNKWIQYHDTTLGKDAMVPINYYHPIRYVYYSECDQIVHYDTMETFRALSTATNDSTFFVGKRREKIADSEPEDYLGSLNNWRNCGQGGYSLRWPKDSVVRYTG